MSDLRPRQVAKAVLPCFLRALLPGGGGEETVGKILALAEAISRGAKNHIAATAGTISKSSIGYIAAKAMPIPPAINIQRGVLVKKLVNCGSANQIAPVTSPARIIFPAVKSWPFCNSRSTPPAKSPTAKIPRRVRDDIWMGME